MASHLGSPPEARLSVLDMQGGGRPPDIVVTSYHMLQNLSCEGCKAGKAESCLGALVRSYSSIATPYTLYLNPTCAARLLRLSSPSAVDMTVSPGAHVLLDGYALSPAHSDPNGFCWFAIGAPSALLQTMRITVCLAAWGTHESGA